MKILRVISSVNPAAGGPINGLVNSSKELVKLGHEVSILSVDDPSAIWVKDFDFPLVSFKSEFGSLNFSRLFNRWLDLNVTNYDVVIIHGLWQFNSYAAAKACIKHKVPYVIFTHGMLDPWFNKNQLLKTLKKNVYWKLLEHRTINNASTVLFTSEEEKKLARQSFSPYSPIEKVVAYGCPLFEGDKKSLTDTFYNKFPQLKDCQFGLFLSRIHTKKGIDLLIEALAKLTYIPDNFKLAIAGPDSDGLILKLKQLINSLELNDRVVWLDMVKDEMKWGAYHASEFFILPSHQENFGIVVAEALSTGTPVLITNKVNIWREIEESRAGLIANDDVVGVHSLLERWFDLSKNDKRDLSLQAKLCYSNNFSILSAATDLEAVLKAIVYKEVNL